MPEAKINLVGYDGDHGAVIRDREATLRTLGFDDQQITTLYNYRPSLYDSSTVHEVATFADTELGLDVTKVVMSYHGILSIGVPGIRAKLDGLQEVGFNDPKKISERFTTSFTLLDRYYRA